MRLPIEIQADNLCDFYYKEQVRIDDHWYISKPRSQDCWCILQRFKLAWKVFIGQTDILKYKQKKRTEKNVH